MLRASATKSQKQVITVLKIKHYWTLLSFTFIQSQTCHLSALGLLIIFFQSHVDWQVLSCACPLRVAPAGVTVMRSLRSLCGRRWHLRRETWSSVLEKRLSTRDPNLLKPWRKRDPGKFATHTRTHIVLSPTNTLFWIQIHSFSFSEALSLSLF